MTDKTYFIGIEQGEQFAFDAANMEEAKEAVTIWGARSFVPAL